MHEEFCGYNEQLQRISLCVTPWLLLQLQVKMGCTHLLNIIPYYIHWIENCKNPLSDSVKQLWTSLLDTFSIRDFPTEWIKLYLYTVIFLTLNVNMDLCSFHRWFPKALEIAHGQHAKPEIASLRQQWAPVPGAGSAPPGTHPNSHASFLGGLPQECKGNNVSVTRLSPLCWDYPPRHQSLSLLWFISLFLNNTELS